MSLHGNDPQKDDAQQKTIEDEFLRLRMATASTVEAARAAVHDITRLTRLLSILNEPGPLDLLLDKVLSTLSEVFLADIVVLLDPAGTGSFAPLAAVGLPENYAKMPFSYKNGGLLSVLTKSRMPVLLEQADMDSRVDVQLKAAGAKTLVALPVEGSPATAGALLLARCSPKPFSDAEVPQLMTMAFRIGRTILEAQRSTQFEKVSQSGRVIGRNLDLNTIYTEAVRMFPAIVRADAAALMLSDPNGKFSCAARAGLEPSAVDSIEEIAKRVAARFPETDHFASADMEQSLAGMSLEGIDVSPVKAILAMPLHSQGRVCGVLVSARFSAIPFNTDGLRIAAIYADQVSAAIENAGLYQAVRNELTERKKLEDERKKWDRQQQQLQKAESLNRMAAAIAHHFNNMLMVIIGNIQLASMDLPQDQPPFDFLDQALKASGRAAEVSSLMLTYLGQSIAKREVVSLSEMCQGGIPVLKIGMPQDIVLEVDIPFPGPTVNANANELQQVLKNLLTNAFESADGKEGVVSLSIKTVSVQDIPASHRFPVDWKPQGDRFACIAVKDCGSGIMEKEIDQIFDPFFSTKFTGRGLGLPVALGIVRAHQGLITVESARGEGSTFKVFFPLSPEQAEPLHRPPPEDAKKQDGGLVLLVDDEDMVREMAASMLTRIGYAVIEARDGEEAVDMFRQRRKDIRIVLCDLTMPKMNGWQTLEALHAIAPDVRFILASGYSESQVMHGEHPLRPAVFLHKPYHLSDLRQALATALS